MYLINVRMFFMYEFLIIVGIIVFISALAVVFAFLVKRIINIVLSKRKNVKPKIIFYHHKKHE